MRRAAAALVTALALASVAVGGAGRAAAAGGGAKETAGARAKAKKKPRCEVVVFKRRGKTVRRCRLQRRATAPAGRGGGSGAAGGGTVPAGGGPAGGGGVPAGEGGTGGGPAGGGAAPAGGGETPAGGGEPGGTPSADPWFLTLYARDVGNGDFRLTPAVGDIPAGRLVLSYKNVDVGEHDLWLRRVEPAGPDTQLFAPSSSTELRRTELTLAPGRYAFLCALPGHDQMRQDVRVMPSTSS